MFLSSPQLFFIHETIKRKFFYTQNENLRKKSDKQNDLRDVGASLIRPTFYL